MLHQLWISGNTPSSKNAKVWTGSHLVNSKAVQQWLKATKEEWEYQREYFINAISELPFPLYIEFTFYRKSKHKFDYINMAQIVQDIMVEVKWLPEDNADILKPYFGDYIYNKKNPGVLIKILKTKPKHY
jgi:hypothetical protein